MKKAFKKMLRKDVGIAIVVLFIVVIGISSYTLHGIYQNVQKMAESDQETPHYATYPPLNTAGKNTALIQRGEYLTKAGDCIACHTNSSKPDSPAFAGGLPMPTPFGTIYSPNITPDKETGIGRWTNEQFIKAMREGISPQGHYYYPAFPYLYFNKITTDDLEAIKAYLDSVPPVHLKNREHEMIWPFNWRFMQFGWRFLFFRENTGPYPWDSKQSDAWNRGAYLAEGLGHCAMCHSPSYKLVSDALPLGAPIRKYDLTGAKIQGYLAPNITKANLATTSEEEITEVFTKDKMLGGGHIEGPMLEVNHDSLMYLSHADLLSLATYLKSVQSQTPPIRKSKDGPGRGLYETYCSGCHTTGAGGAPQFGDANAWDALVANGLDKLYNNAIKGKGGMPAKGTCLSCSDDDIKQTVNYMIAAAKSAPKMPAPIPKLTLEDGKRLYDQNCAVCHATGFKQAPKPGDMKTWEPIIQRGFLETYSRIMTDRHGHIPHGACPDCSDAEVKAALKYMMQQSTTTKDFSLW